MTQGNTQNSLEICVQFQGCDIVCITETLSDDSHNCNDMAGYWFLRKNWLLRQEECAFLCVREQLGFMDMCLQEDVKLPESLLFRIKERTSLGNVTVSGHMKVEQVGRSFTDRYSHEVLHPLMFVEGKTQ